MQSARRLINGEVQALLACLAAPHSLPAGTLIPWTPHGELWQLILDRPLQGPLTLEQVVELAATHNPELGAFQARAEAARGRLIQAGLYLNPKLNWLGAEMNLGHGNSAGEQGPLFIQEFVTANKIRLAEGAAAHGLAAADWAAVTKWFDVMTRVRLAYFEALTAQAEIKSAEDVEAIAKLGLATAQKLQKAGAGARPDLLQAQVELNASALRVSLARQRLDTAWKLLASTVGVTELPPGPLAMSLEEPPPAYEWQQALAIVLSRSSEVQEAQSKIYEAQMLLRRAHAERVPNVTAGIRPFYSFVDKEQRMDFEIGLPLPIFNRNQGNIHSAQADVVRTREEARLVELKLQERLALAFQRYRSAQEQVTAIHNRILPDAVESLQLVRKGYEAGDAKYGYTFLLQAQRTVAQAHLARVQALGELWRAATEIAGLLQE